MKTKILTAVLGVLILSACPGVEDPIADPIEENTCELPTRAPIEHSGTITTDETWSADAPHLVSGRLRIDGARVTIEPCAIVRLEPGASIVAGVGGSVPAEGHLVAEGMAQKPIRFERAGTEPWGGLVAQWPGTVSLAHAILEGGGDNGSWDDATLVAHGDGEPAMVRANLRVKAVTVRNSRGYGVVADYAGAFLDGSEDLTVTGAGSGSNEYLYPVSVGPHALGTVPSGAYTGNAIDAIRVTEGKTPADATVKKVGVPYRLVGIPGSTLTVAGQSGGDLRTLTIEPGVVFQFEAGTHLRVGIGDAVTIHYPGALVAVGTASEPILFTSANAQPQAGDWRGIAFHGDNTVNRLEQVRIEYAGGECSCVLATCAAPDIPDEYAIWLDNVGDGSYRDFIHNVTIAHSANHGILCSFDSDALCPDFTDDNSFIEVAACRQILNRDSFGSCTGRAECL